MVNARESSAPSLCVRCTKSSLPDKPSYGDGSSGRRSDVRSDRVVAGQAPVAFGDAEHLDDVPVRVVVAEERRVPVLGGPARLEVSCGGRYGVPGIHYVGHPVAVAVNPGGLPGRWQELHRAHRPGGGRAHVRPVVRLVLPHGCEDVPVLSEPILSGGLSVEFPVRALRDRLDRFGHYVVARDPELVAKLRPSDGGGRLLFEDAGSLCRPELAQPALRSRLPQTYGGYGLPKILLAAAQLSSLCLLFL